ncbi:cytochrome B [Motiliproteus coralliicola]|uniref:Cytochrome B n=1 Tax=Motiliproteus coralliicola TaxID=2283196 RepID=A0A369WCD4_9GAMM|nr:cytochrome b/b6 domain-containing protein [Motiliproteus coralliicola]RDE19382.1 cytochrome B [Motiliproteus coralliicola]
MIFQQRHSPTVKVWDPYVRIFHWSLVFFFTLAFVTEDDWLRLHTFAGYTVTGLVIFRVCWGLIGSRYARFSHFLYRPSRIAAYLRSLLTRHPKHYLGHNPAGGAMILLMLLMLSLTAFTGMATLATEGLGPLAGTFFAFWSEDLLEESHELFANAMLLLVFLHIAGVLVSSLLHRENLILAMLTGRKKNLEGETHE